MHSGGAPPMPPPPNSPSHNLTQQLHFAFAIPALHHYHKENMLANQNYKFINHANHPMQWCLTPPPISGIHHAQSRASLHSPRNWKVAETSLNKDHPHFNQIFMGCLILNAPLTLPTPRWLASSSTTAKCIENIVIQSYWCHASLTTCGMQCHLSSQ